MIIAKKNTPNLSVKYDEKHDLQVLYFTGSMDRAGIQNINNYLSELATSFDGRYLVFDFSGVDFISSEEIEFIMDINNQIIKHNANLVIVGANPHVIDVMEVIGAWSIIGQHATFEDFILSLKTDQKCG